MLRNALVMVIMAPTPAFAQSSMTNCTLVANTAFCHTQQQQPVDTKPVDYIGAMGGIQNMPRPSYAPSIPAGPTKREREAEAMVSTFIARGDCDGAVAYAAANGGLIFAERVRAICR